MHVKSEPVDESRCWMLQLVQALVDKYNEDHNLFKVCSLSLLHVLTLYHATSWSASCYTTVLFVHLTTSRWWDPFFLSQDLAFEVKDVVCYEVIYEGNCLYYHINFTTRTKGAKTADNLFFSEVKRMPGEDEKLVVSCTCMVDPFDNGILYSYQMSLKYSLNVFVFQTVFLLLSWLTCLFVPRGILFFYPFAL